MPLYLLLPKLEECARRRRTSELFSVLRDANNHRVIRSAKPKTRDFLNLLIIIAEAVEFGYPDHDLLQELVQKLSPPDCRGFEACLAKGVVAARQGKSGASLFFRRALAEKSFKPREHVAFARSCWSNILRKQGKYDEADRENDRARQVAAAANLVEIEADYAVAGGWLRFHKGNPSEASDRYDHAEPILNKAGDHRRLADISSARGRIEQRVGRLAKADTYYQASLLYYDQCPVAHRGNGRTLVNFAKLKWLQARRLGLHLENVQQRLAETTLATHDLAAVSLARIHEFLHKHNRQTVSWSELEKLCDLDRRQYGRNANQSDQLARQHTDLLREAHGLLDRAKEFYTNHPGPNLRGLGRERIIRAYVLIEERKWAEAISLANLTFDLGKRHGNGIIQARAKIVETMAYVQQRSCAIELSADQISSALCSGMLAVDLSEGLEDTRIKFKAQTWCGLAQLLQSPPNTPLAVESVKKIEKMLVGMPDDYVTEDSDMLKRQCEQQAVNNQSHDLRDLAKILDDQGTWDKTKDAVLDFIIERLLRQHQHQVEPVRRELRIHPRRVRKVRDKLQSTR